MSRSPSNKVAGFRNKQERAEYFLLDERRLSQTKVTDLDCKLWEKVIQFSDFFTGTLDKAKFDRFDLDTFAARLMQFILDKRKKYASTLSCQRGKYALAESEVYFRCAF